MADVLRIYKGNDNLLEVTGLQNAATDAYLNSATVTAVVTDIDGNTVTNADSITLSYVSASNGNYRGTVPDDADLSDQQQVTVTITADAGAGLKAVWTKRGRVELRRT